MALTQYDVDAPKGSAARRRGALPALDPVAQATYQKLARKHLHRGATTLFKAYTGMRLTVTWAPPPSLPWPIVLSPPRARYCRLICSSTPGRELCRKYAAGQLKHTLEGTSRGRQCVCPFNVRSAWVPVRTRDVPVAVVQCKSFCEKSSGPAEARIGALGFSPAEVERSRRTLCRLPKPAFDRAVRFLKLIVDDVCQHVENDLEQAELQQTMRALETHEALETRLRKELKHLLPYVHENAAGLEKEGHAQKIVHQALEHIHANSHRPLALQDLASTLGLNPSYLSTLFRTHVGVPFSRYLRELRIEQARDLLDEPRLTIAEVAYAVGFADPNTFRLAFKRMTGLAPSAWRDLFHAK